MPSKYHWRVGLPQSKVPYLWQEWLHIPCHEYKLSMATSSICPGFGGPLVDSMHMPYLQWPTFMVTHEQATTILTKHAQQINNSIPYSKISTWLYTKWDPNLAKDAYRMHLIKSCRRCIQNAFDLHFRILLREFELAIAAWNDEYARALCRHKTHLWWWGRTWWF
jgi:hypothetical protein